MADNVTSSTSDGLGAVFATDDDGTAHHPYVKLEFGADDTQTKVSASDPLPVTVSGVATATKQDDGNTILSAIETLLSAPLAVTGTFYQATQPVSAASLPLPTGAATEATLATLSGNVTACNTGAVVISSGTVTANAGTNLNTSSLATSANITNVFGSSLLVRNEDVASADAHAGIPVYGIRRDALVANAAVSADGDYTPFRFDNWGALHVKPSVAGLLSTSQSVTATTSTAASNFTAVSSTYNFVTSVTVYNSSATPTFLKMQDGSGGTTLWVFPAPAGGGTTHNFDPPLKQPTSNTALYFAANDAVTTLYVSINGFQAK